MDLNHWITVWVMRTKQTPIIFPFSLSFNHPGLFLGPFFFGPGWTISLTCLFALSSPADMHDLCLIHTWPEARKYTSCVFWIWKLPGYIFLLNIVITYKVFGLIYYLATKKKKKSIWPFIWGVTEDSVMIYF